jgi:type I restriction-modification system DNA methylase subunit
MAKLTKDEVKRHNEALRILEKEKLTYDEKVYVYENWNEGAESMNSKYGAFFTPFDFANDFNLEVFHGNDRKIIDLCAGIGMLSFTAYHHCDRHERPQITCVELNPDYAEVGKKLLPEANWIVGSVTDKELIESLGHYDQCISNPPFGKISHPEDVKDWLKYKGAEFEFKVMEIASKVSDYGTFIVPQGSTPFRFSGAPFYVDYQNRCKNDYGSMPMKVQKFINETGYSFLFNVGIDTKTYVNLWKGVSPICEVVSIDYSGKYY